MDKNLTTQVFLIFFKVSDFEEVVRAIDDPITKSALRRRIRYLLTWVSKTKGGKEKLNKYAKLFLFRDYKNNLCSLSESMSISQLVRFSPEYIF